MVNHQFLFYFIFILLVISLKRMLALLFLLLGLNSISVSIMIIINLYHPFYSMTITYLFDLAIINFIYSHSYLIVLLCFFIIHLFI